ncbi:MAG: hypothetical protein WBE41_16910 [Terracidiphilus sp.]
MCTDCRRVALLNDRTIRLPQLHFQASATDWSALALPRDSELAAFSPAFWTFAFVLTILAVSFAPLEMEALGSPGRYAGLDIGLIASAIGLWAFNTHRTKSAVLYFEELPDPVITTLGLSLRPTMAEPERGSTTP